MQLVGQTVRSYRQQLGLSQEDLAHNCGVHRTYVGHVERGEVNPTLGTLQLLAEGLGVRVQDLVSEI